jgi:uncharacterized protein YxjI
MRTDVLNIISTFNFITDIYGVLYEVQDKVLYIRPSSNLKIKNVFMLATRETVTQKINYDFPILNVEANIFNYVTETC